MKRMNPSLFQSLEAQRRQEDLCSRGRGKYVYLHPHSTLCLDTSLQGGTLPGAPLDRGKYKFFSQLWVAYAYLAKEGALEKLAQRRESLMNSEERLAIS